MEKENIPDEPKRVRAFANFFKRYMSLSSLIVAALPIPLTSFRLIPAFDAQKTFLSIYTSLFCFLLLGFIFYIRHNLARLMFPDHYDNKTLSKNNFLDLILKIPWRYFVALLPAILIGISIWCVFLYNDCLMISIKNLKSSIELGNINLSLKELSTNNILRYTNLYDIPNSSKLIIYYLGIFLFAEAAFIIMAIKEFLQDILELREIDVINGPFVKKIK